MTTRFYTKKRKNTNRLGRKRRRTRRHVGGKKKKTGKKWVTAIGAADETFRRTHSLLKAKQKLNEQALLNAQKLFGSVGESH